MRIDLIAGARPNFVKIAAILHACRDTRCTLNFRLIHTGQHYDRALSDDFFSDLELPPPDINLGCGSGSQAEQTAAIILAYEKVLLKSKPDICLVVGDVTSSMACAVTAKKMQVRVAHIEAGLRSHDWTMPEEVNRVLIDSISDYFFTTSRHATENLLKEGHREEKIFFVGNTMIDSLIKFRRGFTQPQLWEDLGLKEKEFIVLTLHRPGNVDGDNRLKEYLNEINSSSHGLPVIFPVHPRTAKFLKEDRDLLPNIYYTPPLSYLEFNYLAERAKLVITDSGGITEETTVLGVPCITLRENTERPETVTVGTNEMIGTDPKALKGVLNKIFHGEWKKGGIPEKWDGKAGERIIEILLSLE